MVKVNSKTAREGLRKYIRENYNPDGYYEYEDTTDVKKISANILSCFYDEKVRFDSRKMIFEDLFMEWMYGLPSILNADYILMSAKDVLGGILDETEAERDRFTETQAEEMLTRLIWDELLRQAPIWPFC